MTRVLHLWQRTAGHRVATDDVLCAWAGLTARPRAERVLDLGSGQGAVALMMAGAMKETRFVAIEAQDVSFRLLERNVADNGLGDRFTLIHGDLREVHPPGGAFDLVTGTPPFMPPGTGTAPQDPQREAARFELRGGIEAYCAAAARCLAPGGAVSLVMDAARPERYEKAFALAGLSLARITTVVARQDGAPRYLLYLAHGEPVETTERVSFAVRDEDGQWTGSYESVRTALDLPGA